MTREKIKLGNFTYIADLYRSGLDFQEQYFDRFVIMRNYELYNQVVVDKDIYFIERSLYYEIIRDMLVNDSEFTDKITFPIPFSQLTGYSNDYHNFNGLYNENSFYKSKSDLYKIYFNEIKEELYKEYPSYLEDIDGEDHSINSKNFYNWIKNLEEDYSIYSENFNNWILNCPEELLRGKEVYELYDENKNIIDIKCDKIKLYIPLMEKNIDGILHINNYINNINFHFFCKNVDKINIKSENLFNYNNQSYCEYYEILFPNIEYLFGDNIYFNEDLNIQISQKNNNFVKSVKSYNFDLMKLKVLTQPFKIIEEEIENNKLNVKCYIKQNNSILNNYLLYPIGLSFYPYSELEDTTKLYLLNDNFNSHEVLFVSDNKFRISSTLNFNEDNEICIYSKFVYDNLYNTNLNSFIDLYCYYNDIQQSEYFDYKNKMMNNLKEELTELYNFKTEEELNNYIKLYKEEIEEEYQVDFNFIGFYVFIYTDDVGKNVIWNKKIEVDMEDFKEDIYIPISGIFTNWNEVPEKLTCNIKFFDKYLGNIIYSNTVVITKEYIKYIISDTKIKLTNLMEASENNMVIDLQNNKVNFINNITCVINKKEENYERINRLNPSTKILYKPYFFKVQDLQNIKLRTKIVQNIGINLSQYMTKVETFKLVLGGNEYIEIGRNDAFVIFSINANELTQGGRYDIFNQDDDYISSGEYTIY